MRKLYTVVKFVWAKSPIEAHLLEKQQVPDEIYINNSWLTKPGTEEKPGFLDEPAEEESREKHA